MSRNAAIISGARTALSARAGLLVFALALLCFAISAACADSSFTNLLQSYTTLETIAGNGAGRADATNYWKPEFEGGPATAASLSRPHYAMADGLGNIFIVDKDSHSVLRVAPDGTIHTHAGTHIGGFNGEGPVAATNLQLNFPNALWVRADGTVYVLDTGNGRVRRIDTNGFAETLFRAKKSGGELDGGRMLWVKEDESLAYFGNETRIRKWTPQRGLETLASGFKDLGTFYVETNGTLIVADRGANLVYRISPEGRRTPLAGNGKKTGGGTGSPALETALLGPRGIWPAPTGGYLVLLHDGCQLWHCDATRSMHLLIHGARGHTHRGDGKYFYNPAEPRIGEGRSVTVDDAGNLLLCESDYGYVRRIRLAPPKH